MFRSSFCSFLKIWIVKWSLIIEFEVSSFYYLPFISHFPLIIQQLISFGIFFLTFCHNVARGQSNYSKSCFSRTFIFECLIWLKTNFSKSGLYWTFALLGTILSIDLRKIIFGEPNEDSLEFDDWGHHKRSTFRWLNNSVSHRWFWIGCSRMIPKSWWEI